MDFQPVTSLTDAHFRQVHELFQCEWWTQGRTLEEVQRMICHSDYVFGICNSDTLDLVAFARVLTDRTFKAIIFDVIVAQEYRDLGLGKNIMDQILAHPELSAVKHFELYCLPEMVPFYESWGFSAETSGVVLLRRK